MSSRKSNLPAYRVLASVSMASSIISSVTNIFYLDNVGAQLVFSGTPFGSVSFESSIDYFEDTQRQVLNVGNWVPVPVSPSPVINGVAGTIIANMNQLAEPWVRIKFTSSTGNGVLTAYITGKMV